MITEILAASILKYINDEEKRKKRSRLPYPLQTRLKDIERFIKKLLHNSRLQITDFIKTRAIWSKLGKLCLYTIEVTFTGIIIYYSLTHFNWLSVGIIAALATYYIEWLINSIKKKEK